MSGPNRPQFTCLFAAVLGAAVVALLFWATGVRPGTRGDFTQVDVVTTVLTALGVMVAILTFFLAILAFYGFAAFRTVIEERFENLFRDRFDASNPEYAKVVKKLAQDAKALIENQRPEDGAALGGDLPENDPELENDNEDD